MSPSVAVLGVGKMGAGFVRRLRECGHELIIWNRTKEVSKAIAEEQEKDTPCHVAESPGDACSALSEGGLVIIMLANIATVREVIFEASVLPTLSGKIICNIVSGNPDEGRSVAAELKWSGASCIDGAYSGSPAKARAGEGQLFVSSDDGGKVVETWRHVLESLGKVTFAGKVGSARALDYAVVDLYFVNYLCFAANAAMLEAEGVDVSQFAAEAGVRLGQVPPMLEAFSERMKSRDEASYLEAPSATLGTWKNFWGSRLPYFDAHGFPSQLARFNVRLLEEAIGAGGAHAKADVTRLQEVVRHTTSAPK